LYRCVHERVGAVIGDSNRGQTTVFRPVWTSAEAGKWGIGCAETVVCPLFPCPLFPCLVIVWIGWVSCHWDRVGVLSLFKSQALLDEAAVLACLAYVDLNPIRATLADTPEASDYTSIQRRIQTLQAASKAEADNTLDFIGPPRPTQPTDLLPFVGNEREPMPKGLPFHLRDYLELVNWTGQAVREDKRGAIPANLPPILQRLGIGPTAWMRLATQFEHSFCCWVGQAEHVQATCHRLGYQRARGISACRQLFPS